MAAVAAHKQIRLEKAEVRISTRIRQDKPRQTEFDIFLNLDPGLTPREKTILSRCAGMCEVHKLLSGEMRFNYHLAGEDQGESRAGGAGDESREKLKDES